MKKSAWCLVEAILTLRDLKEQGQPWKSCWSISREARGSNVPLSLPVAEAQDPDQKLIIFNV